VRKVTLKDIAKETGVSFSLISKTLNNNTNSQISKEKAELVRKTAERMGYVTNKQARQLRTGKSQTIAVITPISADYATTVYPTLVQGILSAAVETKYDFIFFHTLDKEKEDVYLNDIISLNPDGIIYAVPNKPYLKNTVEDLNRRTELLTKMSQSGKKILFCMEKYHIPDTVSYLFNGEKGCYIGTKYLIEKGHKRIFMCCSEFEDRFSGYKRAMEEHRLPIDGLNTITGFLYSGGYSFVKDYLLKMEDKPEAIFATCDMSAWGILKAFSENDISGIDVLGFDGLELLEYSEFNFPTIVQPIFKIGYEAAHAMVRWIETNDMIPNKLYEPEIKMIKDSSEKPAGLK